MPSVRKGLLQRVYWPAFEGRRKARGADRIMGHCQHCRHYFKRVAECDQCQKRICEGCLYTVIEHGSGVLK